MSTQDQVDKDMKSRYESSGYKLAIDNIIFRQYKMIITMHSGMLHYADNVVIVAGETI